MISAAPSQQMPAVAPKPQARPHRRRKESTSTSEEANKAPVPEKPDEPYVQLIAKVDYCFCYGILQCVVHGRVV